jgi:uncharacterized protein (TIGR00369 family)
VPQPTELDRLLDTAPFARTLGIELLSAERHRVVGRLGWRAELCTAGGILHGGVLMAFADNIGALVAALNLPPGAGTSTIESKSNFFRPVAAGHVRAVGTPLHVGRTTIVVRTEIVSDDDRLVAHVVQTQAVLAPAR